MINIKIETVSGNQGILNDYSISGSGESVTIKHTFSNAIEDKEETENKRISISDFRPIGVIFDNLDYTKLLKECDELPHSDSSFLSLSINRGKSSISITLYCNPKDSSFPEITKLLNASKMIFDLFPVEKKIFNKKYMADLLKNNKTFEDMFDQMIFDHVSFEDDEEDDYTFTDEDIRNIDEFLKPCNS